MDGYISVEEDQDVTTGFLSAPIAGESRTVGWSVYAEDPHPIPSGQIPRPVGRGIVSDDYLVWATAGCLQRIQAKA
jgi:hypothetical protein